MVTFDVDFHPNDSDPTGNALESFGEKDETLREIMEAEIWELANSDSLSCTYVTHIDGNLWCIYAQHRGVWAFLFFAKMAKNSLIMLNGYTRKMQKMPKISPGQIRRARYLTKELQYA